MPFLIFLAEWILKICAVIGLTKLMVWVFRNDQADTERDDGFTWWDDMKENKASFTLWMAMIGLAALMAAGFQELPETARDFLSAGGKTIYLILKWPFILCSVIGVYWIIWWQFIDEGDEDPRTKELAGSVLMMMWHRFWDAQALGVMLLAAFIFAYAIFRELPPEAPRTVVQTPARSLLKPAVEP